jgi:hypothetical protein
MNRMKLVLPLLAGMLLSYPCEAQFLNAGIWKDMTGKHRGNEQVNDDYNACYDEYTKKFPASDVKPGPPGNYYANVGVWLRGQQSYVTYKCMPRKGWKWITKRLIPAPQVPMGAPVP